MIDRTPLRDQVYRELVGAVLSGEYPPGSRLGDRALSEEHGVSRTPVREALMRLEHEGLLDRDLHRGFFVRELTVDEVARVYPVIEALEVRLVREIGRLPADVADRLRGINRRLERSVHDPVRCVELDMEWHRVLTGAAGNSYAEQVLEAAKNLARRYEYAYMRDAGLVPLSIAMHEEITAALGASDAERAAGLVGDHWRFGMTAVERWLVGALTMSEGWDHRAK